MGVALSAVAAMMRSSPPTEAPTFGVNRRAPGHPIPAIPLRGVVTLPTGATMIGVAMWGYDTGRFPGPGGLRLKPTHFLYPALPLIPGQQTAFAFPPTIPRAVQVIRAWGVAPGGALGPPALYRSDIQTAYFL